MISKLSTLLFYRFISLILMYSPTSNLFLFILTDTYYPEQSTNLSNTIVVMDRISSLYFRIHKKIWEPEIIMKEPNG